MRRLFLFTCLTIAALGFASCDSDSGDSDIATANSTVTVAYEGRLEDGTVFDQSSGATFSLRNTIPGFQNGIVGMRVGEMKTFSIAPEDGYGSQGVRDPNSGEFIIPPNATLVFDVELLDVR